MRKSCGLRRGGRSVKRGAKFQIPPSRRWANEGEAQAAPSQTSLQGWTVSSFRQLTVRSKLFLDLWRPDVLDSADNPTMYSMKHAYRASTDHEGTTLPKDTYRRSRVDLPTSMHALGNGTMLNPSSPSVTTTMSISCLRSTRSSLYHFDEGSMSVQAFCSSS